ncbi:hypothetical protein QJS10_CPA05g00933 [Acorus calamus]|uniref:Uncharacterized protein n=1 Tax=Acorus calamus TaxID=4465 RepID=A0AAV9EVF0_ACOCL|nr:hypothetical protein QJS10_CPA05g00933 [Acorus calamus]
MEFLGENIVPDHHNLTSRGLAFFESQQANVPDVRSPNSRNSEGLETVEAPVGFDFLGSQQQLMRGTNPGMSQPQPRQQAEVHEMPIWQQHFMFKQLQEFQRQQHLQQLNQEVRQHNSLNQMSVIAKQTSADQLPPVINGMPIHDAQNFHWQNELTGVEPKIPNTSQMIFLGNNDNWAQRSGSPTMQGFPNGLILSRDQAHSLHSMDIVPQQQDQSLYGAPVSSSRGSLNQYPQHQGVSPDCADMKMKSTGNQVEKTIMQTAALGSYQGDQSVVYPHQVCLDENPVVARQGSQAKDMFGNVPPQNVGSAAIQGNLQNSSPLQRNLQFQEFQERQEQSDWQGGSQEKNIASAGPSQGHVNLDPTEEKLLFSTDDDNWDASFGRGGSINADGSDILNMFPSMQSGSWSALMQSAVAEAPSNDMGLQDEWSGLSFQKIEPPPGIPPTMLSDSGKQQLAWANNDLHAAISMTSRPFPLVGDASPSTSGRAGPSFQHSNIKYVQSDRERTNAPHESLQHSSKQIGMQSDQSPQQRYDPQRAMHVERDADGNIWRTVGGSRSGIPFPGSSGGLGSAKSSIGSPHVQMEDSYKHNLSSFYSKGSEEQQVPSTHQLYHGKHGAVDTSLKHRGTEDVGDYQHQSSKGVQAWKSSIENTDRVSGEEHAQRRDNSSHKEASHDSNVSSDFHPGQLADSGEGLKENSVGSGTGTSQRSSGQGPPHSVSGTHGSQEQGYSGQSKFAGHFVSNSTMDMEKGQSINLQRNMKAEELPSRSTTSVHNSSTSGIFTRSAASPNAGNVHASQNMLELLHKVESSRDGDGASRFGSSDENALHRTSEAVRYDAFVASAQQNQAPGMQGFGLRLGPPSQRLALSTNDLSSKTKPQTVNDTNSLNMEVVDKDPARLVSATSFQSPSPAERSSQRDIRDVKSNVAGQAGNESTHSNSQGNPLATVSSSFPYPRIQQQIQNVPSPSRQILTDQSVNHSVSRGDLNPHAKSASYPRQAPESHGGGGTVTDQPPQMTMPGMASRMSPFRVPSSVESHVSVPTRLYVGNTSHSQSMNVWTNVPAHQRFSGMQSHKMRPIFQSMGPSSGGLGIASQASQKIDKEISNKVGSTSSEFGTCSVNSQQFGYGEEQPGKDVSMHQAPSEMVDPSSQTTGAHQDQESDPKQPVSGNSVASMPSSVHLYQRDIGKGKHVQMAAQMGHASSNYDNGASRRTSSDVYHANYSLQQQMQSVKGSEADPNWKLGKRLKEGAHSSSVVQNMAIPTDQRLIYSYGTAAQHTSFPSDVKMLSFSSEGREDQNATTSFQQPGRDLSSHDVIASGQNDSQSHPHSLERVERPKINPQMAPSWFEQYGSYKNGQILGTCEGLGSQRTAKAAAQQYFFTKVSEGMGTHSFAEQRNETSQVARICQNTPNTVMVHNNLSSQDSQFPNDALAVRPKKRKSAALYHLPWHKKVVDHSQRLQSISMAEMDWAQTANRLVEKMENEADVIEDGSLMSRSRRRLILTTQLMQQILPSLPAAILRADAVKEYENVIYSAAKLALGDACSLISHSRSDPPVNPESGNMVSERLKSSERLGDEFFSKVVEGFIGKARKLEGDLLRLDKRTSLLDIRLECQELEKFSIINRFAKIFNRGNPDGVEGSSSSDPHTRKAFPQRYVTALSMPGNLPDGVVCLSL